MQFLQFAAAVVISYLGLLAGFLLAYVTQEEMQTAAKYLPLLQRIIILVIAVVVTDFFGIHLALKLLIYLATIAVIIFSLNIRPFYVVFGVLLFAVAVSQNTVLILSSMIFLFGLVSGSQHFAKAVKKRSQMLTAVKNLLLVNLNYPVIALIMFLLSLLPA